ncbi:MAG: hypothetical protein VW443_00500 [Pseudomonadales bacterium]
MAYTDKEADQSLIQGLANERLGGDNVSASQEAAAQRAVEDTAQDVQQAANRQEKPSAREEAERRSAPQDEGDNANKRPVTYIDVDFGDGNPRRLSEQQVRDTMNRYKKLNYMHSQKVAPMESAINLVNDMAQRLAQQTGQPVTGDDMAQFLQAASNAYVHNLQMGGQIDKTPDRQGPRVPMDMEAEMAKWEEDNAISLPPMYRDAASRIAAQDADIASLKKTMAYMLHEANNINSQAQGTLATAESQERRAMMQQAGNNLNYAQQQYNLPDEEENDFFNFAYERGYDISDFIDPNMTMRVVKDYAATRNTPEMDRLREMARRRQAYTGTVDLQPGSGGYSSDSQDVDADFINSVANQVYQKRDIG